MSERERWNKKWSAGEAPQAPSPFFARLAPRLIRSLRTRPGARVLDLASGPGRHSLPLARAGIAVDALDCSSVALAQLAQTAGREVLPIHTIETELGDPEDAAALLGSARYDVVLDFFFLDRALIPVLARALKPGGLLVFETRLAPGEIGSAVNPKGYWLAPGELARLLWRDFDLLALSERPTSTKWIAQAIARRR
ncbi:MAG: class I SAM-dependent methyltransferase [Chrysiogenetes bacterium]|nr:class I SAM-dependent methyltransferase [Chrysiogenetes bacterium]